MKNKILVLCLLSLSVIVNAQNESYSQWVANGQPNIGFSSVPPVQPSGSLTTFADLGSFQAATNGATLAFEDFEGGIPPALVSVCTEPVNSASNDACYTPGDLVSGFNITSTDGSGVATVDPSLLGAPSVVIGANFFPQSTVVSFSAADIEAVAMEVTLLGAGNVTLTIAGNSGVLGTVPVTVTVGGSMSFIGLIAPEPITSIIIDGDGGTAELIDNLYFGTAGPPPVIPSLNWYGLALLMITLFAVVRTKVKVK